jgi:ribosomal protein S18 acetylase RimI-like enzyme
VAVYNSDMAVEAVVRRAAPEDLPVLGQLGALLVEVHHAFDPARFFEPGASIETSYASFLGGQLGDPAAVVYVAEVDGTVVGYVYASLEPRSWKELRDATGFIHDVVVVPGVRGSGLATRLVETAARWLEEQGAPSVMLWTAEGNAAAQRLFDRLGFRRTMVEMTRNAG